jgi:shikimate dehydrogenase
MAIPYAEVIGDPIGHSKSPLIHKFWLEKLGIEGDYRATHVPPHALASYFRARHEDPHWRGCNVTMPHKLAIWHLLGTSVGSGTYGPINCVVRERTGLALFNFDEDALLETIPRGEGHVVIIGTGGAATAALTALWDRRVSLISRDRQKAKELPAFANDGYARWFSLDRAKKAFKGADGVINATPLGMRGAAEMSSSVLEALSTLPSEAFVYDMVYDPPRTALIEHAEHAGLRTIGGLTMLVAQAAFAFEKFFDASAPRQHDAELRELLTS